VIAVEEILAVPRALELAQPLVLRRPAVRRELARLGRREKRGTLALPRRNYRRNEAPAGSEAIRPRQEPPSAV
jgi:hypothetical protein